MLAIIRAVESKKVRGARVAVVLSDRADASALEVARKHGIPALWIDPAESPDRRHYDRRLAAALEERGVEARTGLVLLAGFMRLLSPEFVDGFKGRMLNIHPSLLPSFPGVRAQQQALDWGVKVSGCTVHFVVPEVDSGPVVLQSAVKVEPGDTVQTLSSRILREEHRIYPLAVKLFVDGRLKIEGRRVTVRR